MNFALITSWIKAMTKCHFSIGLKLLPLLFSLCATNRRTSSPKQPIQVKLEVVRTSTSWSTVYWNPLVNFEALRIDSRYTNTILNNRLIEDALILKDYYMVGYNIISLWMEEDAWMDENSLLYCMFLTTIRHQYMIWLSFSYIT